MVSRFLKARAPQHDQTDGTERTTIVVPMVGNESDDRLLDMVGRVARRLSADITLMYVVEVNQATALDAELPDEMEKGERILSAAETRLRPDLENKKSVVHTEIIQARAAGAAIVDEAIDRGATSIMMSAMINRKHGKLTTGQTVDYVLKTAPCEVIVTRQSMPDWLIESLEMEVE